MKINTNLQVHIHFKSGARNEDYRAYANALAKVLDPLEQPWTIADVGGNRLIAFVNVHCLEPILVPIIPQLEDVRIFCGQSTVEANEPFISSGE